MADLTDARGFRAKYINALNEEVTANRIIGGDVTVERTPVGTNLRLDAYRGMHPFRIFSGYDREEGSATWCVAPGAVFREGATVTPETSENVAYRATGLSPTGKGWVYTGEEVTTRLVWHLAVQGATYFIAAVPDAQTLDEVLPGASSVIVIGSVAKRASTGSTLALPWEVTQNVRADIVIASAGAGGAAPKPFSLRIRSSAEGAKLDVYEPTALGLITLQPLDRTDVRMLECATALSDVGGGWHEMLADLSGLDEYTLVWVSFTGDTSPSYTLGVGDALPQGETRKYALQIGTITRRGEGTDDDPYTYHVTSRDLGQLTRTVADVGRTQVYVKQGNAYTADLASVTWQRETEAYLFALYGLVVTDERGNTVHTIKAQLDTLPTDASGAPVIVNQSPIRSHAADHIDGFIPYT